MAKNQSQQQPQAQPETKTAEQAQADILKQFKLRRVIWPILIGLAFVVWMLYRDFSKPENNLAEMWANISWTSRTFLWLALAIVMMAVRDGAYMWRMRVMTDRQMSWKACFQVTLLWEFASAASPSVVGGAAVAVYMFIKEKISAGKSTAIVFVTIFLDELFYIIAFPAALLMVGHDKIFEPILHVKSGMMGTSIVTAFWIAYSVIFAYVLFLGIGLFLRPDTVSRWIKRIFTFRFLKRFKRRGFKAADEMLTAAREFKTKPKRFWIEGMASTIVAWLGRYFVLNCVLAAFMSSTMGFFEHVLAFSRQAVLFVLMIVSPTPGSSGLAEFGFEKLFSSMIGTTAMTLFIVVFWRLITYYPYLFIGLAVLPKWLKRVYTD